MRYLTILFLFLLILSISCEKEGPWETPVEGRVISATDSTGIALADVYIKHWDGNKAHDTAVIFNTKSDSSGYFHIRFSAIERYDFYLLTAEKEGYLKSSIEHVDAGSTNYALVELFK